MKDLVHIACLFIVAILCSQATADQDEEFGKLKKLVASRRDRSAEVRDGSHEKQLIKDIESFSRRHLCADYDLKKIRGELLKGPSLESFTSESSYAFPADRADWLKDFERSKVSFTTGNGTAYGVLLETGILKSEKEVEAIYRKVTSFVEARTGRHADRSEGRHPHLIGTAKMRLLQRFGLTVWTSNLTPERRVAITLEDETTRQKMSAEGQYHDEKPLPEAGLFLGFKLRESFADAVQGRRPSWTVHDGEGTYYGFKASTEHQLIKNADCVVLVDNDGKVKLIGCRADFELKANAYAELDVQIKALEGKYARKFYQAPPDTKNGHLVEWKMKFFARQMKPMADNVEAEITAFISKSNSRYTVCLCLLRHENLGWLESLE